MSFSVFYGIPRPDRLSIFCEETLQQITLTGISVTIPVPVNNQRFFFLSLQCCNGTRRIEAFSEFVINVGLFKDLVGLSPDDGRVMMCDEVGQGDRHRSAHSPNFPDHFHLEEWIQ